MSQWEDVPESEPDYWFEDLMFFVMFGCGTIAAFGFLLAIVMWWFA